MKNKRILDICQNINEMNILATKLKKYIKKIIMKNIKNQIKIAKKMNKYKKIK